MRKTAEVLRTNFRSMDVCFRMGGEEFVVLLPETPGTSAVVAAERFRTRLFATEFRPVPDGKPVTMSASIGVSSFHQGDTVEDMVRFADLAMYAAKNGGRNKTVGYEDLHVRRAGDSGVTA